MTITRRAVLAGSLSLAVLPLRALNVAGMYRHVQSHRRPN